MTAGPNARAVLRISILTQHLVKRLLDGTSGVCDRHHHDNEQDETKSKRSEGSQSILL